MDLKEFTKLSKELALEFADAIEKQRSVGVIFMAFLSVQKSFAEKLETEEKGRGVRILKDLGSSLLAEAKLLEKSKA